MTRFLTPIGSQFLAQRDGITVRAFLRRNQGPQAIGMLQPCFFNEIRNPVSFQGLLQYLAAAGKVAAHDRMFRVDPVQGLAPILDLSPKKLGDQLVLHLFNPRSVSASEKETDHPVCEYPIDKCVDDLSHFALPAQLLKKTRRALALHILDTFFGWKLFERLERFEPLERPRSSLTEVSPPPTSCSGPTAGPKQDLF